MAFKVNTYRENKKTGGAQVTILIGEGSSRRSMTRHVDKFMMGRNPHDHAFPMHDNAQMELDGAKSELAIAKTELRDAERAHEAGGDAEKTTARVKQANQALGKAHTRLVAANTAKQQLDKDFPLQVEFLR